MKKPTNVFNAKSTVLANAHHSFRTHSLARGHFEISRGVLYETTPSVVQALQVYQSVSCVDRT